MPERILQQKIFPYDGSQDSTKHPSLISPLDIVDSDNIIFTTYSTKKIRPGITGAFDQRPSGNKHILGGVDFWRLGTQRVVYWDGQDIWAVNSEGIKDNIKGQATLPVDEAVTFEKFAGFLMIFFQDGNTLPKGWAMAGPIFDLNTPANGMPNAPFGRVFLNSLWVPDPSVPGRIIKSRTGDPTLMTGGDSLAIDLDVNDGDPSGITAIFPPFFGSLYVAKRFSIYKITPIVTSTGTIYSVAKITNGVGCNSHNAVVAAESSIIFPSDRGLHYLNSTDKFSEVETSFLSRNIQPPWVKEMNFNRSRYMTAVYDFDLNSYLLTFPKVGRNFPTDLWGFNIAVGKFYRWRDYNQTGIFRYIDFTSKKARTMVTSKEGDIGYIDNENFSDYGKKYTLWLRSGIIMPSGTPDERYNFKFIAPIFVPQTSGQMKLTYKTDAKWMETLIFDLTTQETGDLLGIDFILGESYLGGLPQLKLEKRTIGGYAMTYQWFIEFEPSEQPEINEDFELLGVLVDVDRVEKTIGEVTA